MITTTASPQRNLQLNQLASLLKDQPARALDVIAGSGAIRADDGRLIPADVGVAQIDGIDVHPAQAGATSRTATPAEPFQSHVACVNAT